MTIANTLGVLKWSQRFRFSCIDEIKMEQTRVEDGILNARAHRSAGGREDVFREESRD
jgi:hypothetical protein